MSYLPPPERLAAAGFRPTTDGSTGWVYLRDGPTPFTIRVHPHPDTGRTLIYHTRPPSAAHYVLPACLALRSGPEFTTLLTSYGWLRPSP